MEYYLLPVEEREVVEVEEALKKVDYDVDDRASTWSKEEIDKIVKTMTKDNARNLIVQFLPDPVGDKFADLFRIKFNQSSAWNNNNGSLEIIGVLVLDSPNETIISLIQYKNVNEIF